MYRNKKDIDKYVETLISKLSVKEFNSRALSVGRLYYEVGDYTNCRKYVEKYLTQKDNNAAAHKLLAQTLQKLGHKEKAIEQYKVSLDIDPTQTSTIVDICELLADEEVSADPGRAKYWCEKAEATFPKHPITFKLRARLVSLTNPNSEALLDLLRAELAVRPKDVLLHIKLLNHYLKSNKIKEAFDYSCKVELNDNIFSNNFSWYENVAQVLKSELNINDWLYQLVLLTVKEKLCVLSLSEIPTGTAKSLVESKEHLHSYDQAIYTVAKSGAPLGFGEFHNGLLQHHQGQFAFHAATYLLKKAKKDQLSWREATQLAAPLMLLAWQTVPLDPKVNWLLHAPEKQQTSVHRWYAEGTFRCSQAGHYLLSNVQEKIQSFLDNISQTCSGLHWKDKIYEKLFINKELLLKSKSSRFVTSSGNPILRLPRKTEVEAFDIDAQRQFPSSLHHFVWILLHYKKFAQFKCSLFDMLTPNNANYGPESLNKLDILAFLYSATLTSNQRLQNVHYLPADKPNVLPANITDLLCTIPQLKWWDCAYKFSQNILGTELTDIRATLSRGIEVVRCIDNHGLDPELLCKLGQIFSEMAKLTNVVDEKSNLELRAGLYYSCAIPILEKLKNKIVVKVPDRRVFDYTHKELSNKELKALLEESKLYVAINHFNECEYDKVIEILSNLKNPKAYYYLSQAFKKYAEDESNLSKHNMTPKDQSKYLSLIGKSKSYAYKTLDMLKENEINSEDPIYTNTQELIEELEHFEISSIKNNTDFNIPVITDLHGQYSSDENISGENDHLSIRTNPVFRNISSTPKQLSNNNMTNYRTAIDSQIHDNTRIDPQLLDRIETNMKKLQKRDSMINDFMEETKTWFEENKKLGNQIISTINMNMQNTTDQFKQLKISVDQVKDQIDECRNECKDVGELKKQIAELKKEVNKLKKVSSEQAMDENDLYNLEDDYRANENNSAFAAQLPFGQPQVMSPFNQRLLPPPFPVPPNPYQLYGQNLYNLYNQYSQFAQPSTVQGAPPLFDPTRTQVNYPGIYPTPDQMYLDVANLVGPVPATSIPSSINTVPTGPAAPTMPAVSVAPAMPTAVSKPSAMDKKEISRSLPVNVVITSSDPLPTCTTAPVPVLSVTIPPKHLKGTPHNYQIPMPSVNESKGISTPTFSFPVSSNYGNLATSSPVTNWSHMKNNQSQSLVDSAKLLEMANNSKSFSDGTLLNNSINKSRTLSERSNTSVESYDPCPDFKPIIPLPAEVTVTTGEEDEVAIFSARAKLYRFIDKQWKERGIGDMKLLRHNVTSKVRVLMRREQIHKVCANHVITPEMEIQPMKNETKAYFWVANDFADENLVLEKFSIRFKTAEIAKQFYEVFEKARQDSLKIKDQKATINPENVQVNKNIPAQEDSKKETFQSSKLIIGGFTFTSKPTFKSLPETPTAQSDQPSPKLNVFEKFSFKANNSPVINLFSKKSDSESKPSTITEVNNEPAAQLNNSDTVEEYEPTIDFKPVVPLPALIEVKTGEEDENVLFEHRAKLLRFDSTSKEWKERGLGNIKLLQQKHNDQKVRLLMRREQVKKVCCNHSLTKDLLFQKRPDLATAVTWCAQDFSEGELIAETFCLRFKTAQICDDFIAAIRSAQSKLQNDSKAAKEEQNAAKHISSGFGDQFKPKEGAWQCETCYTNNLESYSKCPCCEQPKPVIEPKVMSNTNWGDNFKPKAGTWECNQCLIRNEINVQNCSACNNPKDPNIVKDNKTIANDMQKFNFGIPKQPSNQTKDNGNTQTQSGWGDQFKPKPGTWECKQCFIRNDNNINDCSACNSPKDPNAINNTKVLTIGNAPKFNFGVSNPPVTEKKTEQVPVLSGWGNEFKPKEGTWECKECYIRNESKNVNTDKCSACDTPRNPSNVKNEIQPMQNQPGTKFNFGIPKPVPENTTTEKPSIFDGTGAHKFTFGIPSQEKPSVVSFGEPKPNISIPSAPEKQKAVNLSVKNLEGSNEHSKTSDLMPTTGFGNTERGKFGFVFKPPTKEKSPVKAKNQDHDSDNEYASEDEGVHIHFNPIMPLPDKVEVVTGEEDENELWAHRAKLFKYDKEWKERGIGVLKILKHKENGKLRVLMRREQVLKICLNHALTPEITYQPKDDKTWLFSASDFSDGELSLQLFCVRFKTNEIAKEFKDAIDNARADIETVPVIKADTEKKDNESEDVIFVSEIQATDEEKRKARELMLPENFYTYANKPSCSGCRGCKEDTEETIFPSNKKIDALKTKNFTTPVKTSTPSVQSPTTSIYGTPNNFDRTVDTSIFRTPLGSLASNAKSSPSNSTLSSSEKDSTNKENSFMPKTNIFSGLSEQKSIFGNISTTTSNVDKTLSLTTVKPSILAGPQLKLGSTISKESTEPTSQSIFGGKTLFNDSKPIFGTQSSDAFTGKSTNNSIFGSDNQSPVNLFANAAKGSIFGPKSGFESKPTVGIFESSAIPKQLGSGNAIFADPANKTWTFGNTNSSILNDKKTDPNKKSEDLSVKPLLDSNLTFETLLNAPTPAFTTPQQSNFQWEGAGQQLFGKGNKTDKKNVEEKNDDSTDNTDGVAIDEEYDPHYEPIVPLPDKIVVTTGEEDEEKIFGQRCKLYRYDDKVPEWKERGVGEMKLLFHPEKKTYRLLLRREQVHKVVLNMLVSMDLELLPMNNSDRAWTWAARNYGENPAGELEMLAVRFKTVKLAEEFKEAVVKCTRSLQAADAAAIREEKDKVQAAAEKVAPLRLPKHLPDSARADSAICAKTYEQTQRKDTSADEKQNGLKVDQTKQVRLQVPEEQQEAEDDAEGEEEDYEDYHNDEYEDYEEEDESLTYFSCEVEATIEVDNDPSSKVFCESAQVQMLYDQDLYSPKIMITDSATGEILADMLIYADTEFQMTDNTCTWTGVDFTTSSSVEKAVTVKFHDSDTAMQFYDSCETGKASTYSSADAES